MPGVKTELNNLGPRKKKFGSNNQDLRKGLFFNAGGRMQPTSFQISRQKKIHHRKYLLQGWPRFFSVSSDFGVLSDLVISGKPSLQLQIHEDSFF